MLCVLGHHELYYVYKAKCDWILNGLAQHVSEAVLYDSVSSCLKQEKGEEKGRTCQTGGVHALENQIVHVTLPRVRAVKVHLFAAHS